MKILLLGAQGQVGYELAQSLAPVGRVYPGTRDGANDSLRIDLANPPTLDAELHAVDPDLIVNAAAYTAVDRAEDEANLAERINHWALNVLGAWAARRGALVVHYSTDYVFDGAGNRPYREEDATAPLGVYGRSKLAGEDALRDSGCEHLILRTAWVYAARGHNFLRTMLRLGGERDELRIVGDQRGAPTSARLLASATSAALLQWRDADPESRARLLGTYHLCAGGECSWYEFATAIFNAAENTGLIARAPALIPIATADYPTRARRPAYSVLDTAKFQTAFSIHLPHWQRGLEAVVAELASMQGAPRS